VNILLIVLNWVEKGTYWRALRFGQHLVARGHTVTLIAASGNRRIGIHLHDVNGVTLVETPDLLTGSLRSGWDPWNTLNRIAWIHNRKFDIIHAFEARPTVLFPALYLQRIRGVPLVMDWCDWFGAGGSVEERPNPFIRVMLRPVETFFEERFRTRGDGSTVINSFLQKRLQALGVPPETILLLRNGSDIENLRPLPREEARQRLGLPQDVRIIGYTGAIFWRDAQLMVKAFNIIHAVDPNTRLLIIGYCNIAIDTQVNFPQAVYQTGYISTPLLNAYLAACDICWLPLHDSGANRGRLPLKLNDYMSAGRAIVATAVGDVTDLMKEHELGLITVDQPNDLAAKVLSLLANPTQREYFEQQTRHVAETVFNWELLTNGLELFYEKVLSG
jgi:glycosyltransferase involved in cell wall biosynthesis